MKSLDNFNTIHVTTLAGYILKYYGPMSHLKLQKLLFYCQAYHLAYFGDELFPENFQAWVHGPVCREIYDRLKAKSVLYSDVAYSQYDFDANIILEENVASAQFDLINNILRDLNSWKDLELESATHSELPWIEARGGIPPNRNCETIISKDTMRSYYAKEISDFEIGYEG